MSRPARMRRLPRELRVTIEGPAGALEALLEEPESPDASRFAVVCHPHPLHGGTLHNKVVHTLARAFHELGVPTVRFNFRGVGASAGAFADGIGETEDALAVVAWGARRWPGALTWLAGFSFGGAVALRAAVAARARGLITVAPAIASADAGDSAPHCPWLIVEGDEDEIVDPAAVLDWAARRGAVPTVTLVKGAGHFFHGRLRELGDAVLAFAGSDWA